MTLINHASSSEIFAQRLREAVEQADGATLVSSPEAFASGDINTIVATLMVEKPSLVVVGPDSDVDTALMVAEQLDLNHPETAVVIVAPPTPTVLERALQAGTRGVISPDADQVEIERVINRALAAVTRRREVIHEPFTETKNRIIPVLAAKGGSGKTTVSSNLAVSLAHKYPGDVVLVDLDLQFGDVGSAFGIEPANTMADVLNHPGEMTTARLKTLLTPNQSTGIYVLAAPNTPAEADDMSPKLVADTLKTLASEFPYVVVDTAAGIDEFTLEVLDIATDLVLLASMDVPSVRAVAKEIDALQMLGIRHADWHLVLNRASSKVGISIEDIEATLGLSIDVRIPSSRSVPLSVNRGVPVSADDRRSPVGRAFEELARRTAHTEAAEQSWLRRRRSE